MIILPLGAVVELDLANACVCGNCPPEQRVWQTCTVAMLHEGEYLLEKTFGTWLSPSGEPSDLRFLAVPIDYVTEVMHQGSMRYIPPEPAPTSG